MSIGLRNKPSEKCLDRHAQKEIDHIIKAIITREPERLERMPRSVTYAAMDLELMTLGQLII